MNVLEDDICFWGQAYNELVPNFRLGYLATGGLASYSMWGLKGSRCDRRVPWICGFFVFQHLPKKTRRLDLGAPNGTGEQNYVIGCWSNFVAFQQVRTTWIFFSWGTLCRSAFSHETSRTLLRHMVLLRTKLSAQLWCFKSEKQSYLRPVLLVWDLFSEWVEECFF